MSVPAARDAVLEDLAVLARRRRRALALAVLVLCGAAIGAIVWRGPLSPQNLLAAGAIAVSIIACMALALGIPMIEAGTARIVAVASTLLVVGAGALMGGAIVPGGALGFGCLAQGVVAGILSLAALTMSMRSLWRRSIDVRWPVSLGATAVVLSVGASVCGHPGGLHMWVAHLPVIPAVYVLAWAAARLVRDRDRLA